MTNDENQKRLGLSFIRNVTTLKKILPFLAFIIPSVILYYLEPITFEKTWKGRTYYLFFLWLICLEIILRWEKLQTEIKKLKSIRTIILTIALSLPTIYVIAAYYWGLNTTITELAANNAIKWASVMPLSTEYLVFTVLFAIITLIEFGVSGMRNLSIPTFFLGIIGMIYTVDNLYPNGQFAPFQIVVPTTAMLAASMLGFMGYYTILNLRGPMPSLLVQSQSGSSFAAFIGWPCAGVDSLLIYGVVIILFLRDASISLRLKIIYFTIGAIVTYFINILRIATIFIIGANGGNVWPFHDYYGSLYSITWIIAYPLIIIGSRALWNNIRNMRTNTQICSRPSVETKKPVQINSLKPN